MSLETGLARTDKATLDTAEVREIGIKGFDTLYHPLYSYAAGYGVFVGVFGRDILESFKLAFSNPANIFISHFMPRAEHSLDVIAAKQGKIHDPSREETVGAGLHEWRNGFSPKIVMEELLEAEWPVEILPDGEYEMRYYGAGDVNGLFLEVVADLAEAKGFLAGLPGSKEYQLAKMGYVQKMWPFTKAAFAHQYRISKTSGYDLIDTIPQNIHTLFNQVEADSDYSYITEEGLTPRPPHFFLHNNAHFLGGMRSMVSMALLMKDYEVAGKAQERYDKGRNSFQELFWMKDEGYYSSLVDGEGNQVRIIRADPLEALWCQVIDRPFADQVVDRLMESDMLTPWGIRSQSANSRRFRVNGSQAYWNGAVWTHQQGKAAIGFENYGRNKEAAIIQGCLFALASAKGAVEVSAVTEDGRLLDYREKGRVRACNPQLFAAAAIIARAVPQELAA